VQSVYATGIGVKTTCILCALFSERVVCNSMLCVCFAYVVCMLCVRRVGMVHKCAVHVVCMLRFRGVYLGCMFCACSLHSVYVVCMEYVV